MYPPFQKLTVKWRNFRRGWRCSRRGLW